MPKISALSAGGALAGTEVVPVVQAGATVKSTIDDIATRVIASDAELAAIAGLTSAADRGLYFTGSGTASLFTFTAAGRALLDDADASAQLTTLGVSAFVQTIFNDADAGAVLTTLGGSANGQSLFTAANFAAMRGLLDLEAGTDFNAYSARLADISGITYAQGDVFYYDGSNIVKLAAGTSGHFLKTQGAGANPVWASAGAGGGGKWHKDLSVLLYEPPTTNYATLSTRNARPVLAFDATTQEGALWSFAVPDTYAGGDLKVSVYVMAASATTGTIGFVGAFERFDASSLDGDSDSFDTDQTFTATTVPGTTGQLLRLTKTFTNAEADDIAAGEHGRFRLQRDVANDTATGDAQVLTVTIEEV
jgi:hypothetical protein